MRRIAEIEAKRYEAYKAKKAATNPEDKAYYEGIIIALDWVRDKGGYETYIYIK